MNCKGKNKGKAVTTPRLILWWEGRGRREEEGGVMGREKLCCWGYA